MMKRNTKKLKYAINSSVVIIGIVVVTILVNALLVAFDSKIPLELNLTRDEIYTLTDESKKIADKIDKETEIVVLFNGEQTNDLVLLTDIIGEYTDQNNNIKLKTVDFANNPMDLAPYAEAIKLIKNPHYAMIFKQGDLLEVAESSTYISTDGYSNIERIITNKLATFVDGFRLSSIVFTTGHGEKLTTGFSSVLEMYNYTLGTIDLLKEELPEDAKTMVIVNSPTGDFLPEEIEKLDAYLDRGGIVQIYFDPLVSNDVLPRLEGYLSDAWAIERNHKIVVDMKNRLESASETAAKYGIISLAELGEHEITSPIVTSKRSVLYSASNAFSILGDKTSDISVTPILTSSDDAYLKENIELLGESQKTSDESGKFNLLLSAERKNFTINDEKFIGKLIVSGSSNTMDTLIGDTRFANEDLLINSINWMRGSDAGITVRAKELPEGAIAVPNAHFWPWFISLVLIIPVLISIAGIVIWLKRRYK